MEGGARSLAEETVVPIRVDSDIVAARQQGRALASRVGFSSGEATLFPRWPLCQQHSTEAILSNWR